MPGTAVFDIRLDSNGDLAISSSGDFSIIESTAQHQQHLILTGQGEWKQNPLVGVDAESYIDDEGSGNLIREIAKAFLADGMNFTNLTPNPNSATDSSVKVFEQAFYK
jgi:hypothetical protein